MNAPSPERRGPLAGHRVVELSSTIAGPVCARLLADFGADVIKIESHEGDPGRNFGAQIDGVSLYASSMYRNKRAIALDLKTPQGRDIALQLLDKADILVENFRPGVLDRLGLGEEVLRQRNPGLVTVRISGYGQSGPYRDLPGYGAICEAVAGVRHLTGDPDRPPARCALATTDYLTAVYAAFGTVMALYERTRSGIGQMIDVALYESAFSQMEEAVPTYARTGYVPKRQGSRLMNTAPNSLYPTQDGHWVLIAANNDAIFRRLANAMGHPEWATDPRYATQRARGERVEEIDGLVTAWSSQQTADDAVRILMEAEVPTSRVNTIADIFEDQHYRAREMLLKMPHPTLGEVTMTGVVPKLSRTPGEVTKVGSGIGEDTRDVLLNDLGMSEADLTRLEAARAIWCGPSPAESAHAGASQAAFG
ncbi:CaiB/BaiF CoA transferase family protein [Hydrogenophaga sp. BPS33]|uniref:CaiB/BaiF CoA transferase family protein n=1 Tax=Hydrogenophaga sp. BPS33 TaxID=2651974 RepID=UPI00131F7012|nr:CoA transferase [Hydrogenophaga sp. BPS33]QHE86051.1 CoA transferase [Hydrogenophaga sp. BPS33]